MKAPKQIFVDPNDHDEFWYYESVENLMGDYDDDDDIEIHVYELKKKMIGNWDKQIKVRDKK